MQITTDMHRAAALIPDLAASDITRPDTIVPDCQWRNSMKKTAVALAFFCVLVSASFAAAQSLTGPQRNAVRSANNYLSFQGFSRDGLIEQLSSPYGDGYSRADATAAVNSLAVDWNEQAARSAEQYLSIMGFSCNGLIAQLSSDAGSKFTTSEATYGARKAGAC